ncbi:hypothetical protein NC651_020432 [Populus alba x Populus x berolinensis]|nr:hypothetical protein NC651_020432 [Populus alba x Populus x berolinensis]
MRHPRRLVLSGCLSALIVMTILSASVGWAAPNLISRAWTHHISTILFFGFGLWSLWDGFNDKGEAEELAEVEAKLDADWKANTGTAKAGSKDSDELKKQRRTFLSQFFSPILLKAFSITFFGEWGDKSQIATIGLAADENPFGVVMGGIVGHALCTTAAVIGGKTLASQISEKIVALSGGALFIVFGIQSFLSTFVVISANGSVLADLLKNGGQSLLLFRVRNRLPNVLLLARRLEFCYQEFFVDKQVVLERFYTGFALDSATNNTYMIVRLGFLVAASIAAFTVKQLNVKTAKSSDSSAKRSENGEASFKQHQVKEDDKQHFTHADDSFKEKDVEEEEEEEVKLISSIFDRAQGTSPSMEDGDILPQFEDLLSGEMDHPLHGEKFDKAEKDMIYETEMENNASELECLRNLVKELEGREVKLEDELLEYYGLKEQESDIVELQRQIKIKTVEIDTLNITINSLQAERKKLQEEILLGASAKKELELSRNKIKELQRQIQLNANQTRGQLLLLKQQVSGLQSREQEAMKKDAEAEKRLKAAKELEVEVVELKRKNKELQHEKRELTIKLGAAEAKVASLSNMTEVRNMVFAKDVRHIPEIEMVAKVREEANNLRHTKEDLLKQVEGLQMNRFSEVEEIVYLRWVNACLRSFSGGSPSRTSMGHRPRGPLETLMLRNAGDTVAITSFGKMEQDAPDSPGDSLNSVASSFQVMSKSVGGVLDEKYPAYKDRHKLALEREKHVKEKAEQARAARFGDSSNFDFGTKGKRDKPVTLPVELSQLKEKPVASGGSNYQSNDGKDVDSQITSKMKLAHIEKRPPKVPRPPP